MVDTDVLVDLIGLVIHNLGFDGVFGSMGILVGGRLYEAWCMVVSVFTDLLISRILKKVASPPAFVRFICS